MVHIKIFMKVEPKEQMLLTKMENFMDSILFIMKNGQIYVQVNYKRGNINGDVSFFDDQGQLIEIVKYKNGKPVNEGK